MDCVCGKFEFLSSFEALSCSLARVSCEITHFPFWIHFTDDFTLCNLRGSVVRPLSDLRLVFVSFSDSVRCPSFFFTPKGTVFNFFPTELCFWFVYTCVQRTPQLTKIFKFVHVDAAGCAGVGTHPGLNY